MLDGTQLNVESVESQKDLRPTMPMAQLEKLHDQWEIHGRGEDPYTIYREVPDESIGSAGLTDEIALVSGAVVRRSFASFSGPLDAGLRATEASSPGEAAPVSTEVAGIEADVSYEHAESRRSAKSTAFLTAHLEYARSSEDRDAEGNLTKEAKAAWDRFDGSIHKFIKRNGFAGLTRVDAEVAQAYVTRFMETQGQKPVERDLLSAIGNLDPATIKLFADLYEKANGIAAVEGELPASILEVHYGVEDQPDIIDPRILIIDHLGRPISVLDEDGEVKGIHDVSDLDFPDPDDDRVGKPRHKGHAA